MENEKPINLTVPRGTVSLTQWNKMGDHFIVLQNYESSHAGDVDLDEYFIPNEYIESGYAKMVQCGDWIAKLENGKFTVI